MPEIARCTPQVDSPIQVIHGNQNWRTTYRGVSPEYFDIRDWPMASGSRFTPSDLDTGRKVVVLGQTVVDHLFGFGTAPVGQNVRIKGVPFQVIGVLAKKGQCA